MGFKKKPKQILRNEISERGQERRDERRELRDESCFINSLPKDGCFKGSECDTNSKGGKVCCINPSNNVCFNKRKTPIKNGNEVPIPSKGLCWIGGGVEGKIPGTKTGCYCPNGTVPYDGKPNNKNLSDPDECPASGPVPGPSPAPNITCDLTETYVGEKENVKWYLQKDRNTLHVGNPGLKFAIKNETTTSLGKDKFLSFGDRENTTLTCKANNQLTINSEIDDIKGVTLNPGTIPDYYQCIRDPKPTKGKQGCDMSNWWVANTTTLECCENGINCPSGSTKC